MAHFKDQAIERIRRQVGKGRVICGLSGGVDSAVAAVLIHEAIGDQLHCIFVDHGLLRAGRGGRGGEPVPRPLQHPARSIATPRDLFLGKLAGVTDPEQKRKIIGGLFIDVFEEEAKSSAAPISWPRARSIPMSSNPSPSAAGLASPSSRITMWAACRRACA